MPVQRVVKGFPLDENNLLLNIKKEYFVYSSGDFYSICYTAFLICDSRL